LKFLSISLLILALFLFGTARGWDNPGDSGLSTGTISGVIKNRKGKNLPAANIIIIENQRGCSSDHLGRFEFKDVYPGHYTLRVSYVSYETRYIKVLVSEHAVTDTIVELSQSLFQIGGIEVIGSTQLLPEDAATKTIITSGEIEHYQASSVKDVLNLVPGVQRSENPGLSQKGQLAIRGDIMDRLATFGTLIIVDGVPITKNSDLQFESPGSNLLSIPTVMSGIDLRTIPADNIEKIEVLSGLPSVKYGDFTEGVVNIKTKTGLQPHRLKIKDNPDTREANLGGGFKNFINYNVNLARSERDIRIEGDEYTRFTSQISRSDDFFDNTLEVNHKINTLLIFDEEKPKGDIYKTVDYDRGFGLGYSGWGSYLLSGHEHIDFNMFVNVHRKNSMKSKLVQSELMVLPGGDTVASYIGKVQTKGFEWTTGGKLDWSNVYFTGNILHRLSIGADIQYDANTGQGIMFDSIFSYYGAHSGKRPYSFSSIPGQLLLSFYAEDQITGKFFFDYKISAGLRYETYRPYKFNIQGIWSSEDVIEAHQGTFLNPRINLILYFSQYSQMRLNAGRTSKSPAMALIYPPEEVFRWRNPLTGATQYFRYDQSSPELKGISEDQLEISFDQKVSDDIAASLTFYYKERRNGTTNLTIPVFFPLVMNNTFKVYYIDDYSRQINSGWNISKGAEIVLNTNRIKPLNMNFQVTASYRYMNSSDGGNRMIMDYDLSKGQYPNYRVLDTLIGFIFPNQGKWSDRIQMNYNIKYTLPALGLWVSFRAEHVIGERFQNYNLEPEDYSLLSDYGKLRYTFDRLTKTKGPKWLFNVNISKSLFKGAEVSFYVNNLFDDPAVRRFETLPFFFAEEVRNPALFYGMEFSTIIDEMFK